jgi:hypothetical protein
MGRRLERTTWRKKEDGFEGFDDDKEEGEDVG